MRRQNADAPLTDTELQALGLARDPFLTKHEELMAEDPTLLTQRHTLLNLLRHGEQLVLLHGEAGTGKSHFLRSLPLWQGETLRCLPLAARPSTTLEEILADLLLALDLASAEDTLSAEQAGERLRAMGREGLRPALLLDDADQLDGAVLDELLNLWHQDGEPAFGLLLVSGDAGFAEELGRRLDDQGLLHRQGVYPWTGEQSLSFLRLTLSTAGGEHSLSQAELERLVDEGEGRPDRLLAAGRALLRQKAARAARGRKAATAPPATDSSAKTTGRRWMLPALLVGAAGLSAVLIAVMLPGGAGESESEQVEVLELPPRAAEARGDGDSPYGLKLPQRYDYDRQAAQGTAPSAISRAPGAGTPAAMTPPADGAAATADAGATTTTPPSSGAAADRQDAAPAEAEATPVSATEAADTADAPAAAPTAKRTANTGATPDSGADQRSEPAASPDSAPATAADTPWTVATALRHGADWVQRQPGEHYTIQLLGAARRDTAERFIRRHDLEQRSALLATRRRGGPWYVVLTGEYSSAQWAREGIKRLDPALRQAGPWIRQLRALRAEAAGD